MRWDKNFLTLVHLTLARRRRFEILGGVRFGGTLNAEQAFAAGFDHVAIAAGAGRPTIIPMKNNIIRGVRKASDFLMALQLTGAFKEEALANLQVELPAVVIGGGLTAIDTATELLAYYPLQAEKTLARYETLAAEKDEATLRAGFDSEEREILNGLLAHGLAVRQERERARAAGEEPDLAKLCREWGGVSIAYRRSMEESPAYRLNHEEVIKALEEGISFIENLEPVEAVPDGDGKLTAVRFQRGGSGEIVELAARTCLVAAGTTPNITYAKEYPDAFPLDAKRRFFAPHRAVARDGGFALEPAPAEDEGAFFTGYSRHGKFVTFFGDNHPAYNGNVVKAMASARNGYRPIMEVLDGSGSAQAPDAEWEEFRDRIAGELSATVVAVERLTPTIVEVVVRAPAAARNFEPGQFFRLQNLEATAARAGGSPLLIEPCALTGAWVDARQGLLSLIALEIGGSTRLCSVLKPGEPVVVMGPTGSATELPENSTVMLCGGGLGNAVLFSIGKNARARGNQVIYFAGYKKAEDFYKREELEAASDVLVLSVDRGEPIPARRPSRPQLHRQHRRGDDRLRDRQARRDPDSPVRGHADHRHRIRPDDGGRGEGPQKRPGVFPFTDPRRHRVDQLADAMHDEGSLRTVPAAARGSRDRQGGDRLLLLQPGPEARRDGLGQPRGAPAAEHGFGEADESLAGPVLRERGPESRLARSSSLSGEGPEGDFPSLLRWPA